MRKQTKTKIKENKQVEREQQQTETRADVASDEVKRKAKQASKNGEA